MWAVCEARSCRKWRIINRQMGEDEKYFCGDHKHQHLKDCEPLDDWIVRCLGKEKAKELADAGIHTVEGLAKNHKLLAKYAPVFMARRVSHRIVLTIRLVVRLREANVFYEEENMTLSLLGQYDKGAQAPAAQSCRSRGSRRSCQASFCSFSARRVKDTRPTPRPPLLRLSISAGLVHQPQSNISSCASGCDAQPRCPRTVLFCVC